MNGQTADSSPDRPGRGRGLPAAEDLFREYEPYLRMVVRRLLPRRLRSQFDSADVVQSAWAHVLRGLRSAGWHFADRSRLRALLATVARRRLITRLRRHREDGGAADAVTDGDLPAPNQPRPSEFAQAGELWDKMLAACPPAHHELLRLRSQGLALQEVAARTGIHEGSVRRVLRRLARQLALRERPLAVSRDGPEGRQTPAPEDRP
jgi:RNA polymerase sigma-70 factor (ECF subfamily)